MTSKLQSPYKGKHVFQAALLSQDTSHLLYILSTVMPQRWQHDFWKQQLPDNWHQLQQQEMYARLQT